jgi:hypothetical protein
MAALGPLAFFVPKLTTLRKRAMLEYGTLAQIQAADFHERWVLHRRDNEEFVNSPRVSTLTDVALNYEYVQNMQPFPIDKVSLVILAAAVLLPLIPALLAEIPSAVILKGVFQAVTSPII